MFDLQQKLLPRMQQKEVNTDGVYYFRIQAVEQLVSGKVVPTR